MLFKKYPKIWMGVGIRAFVACAALLWLASCGGGGGAANTQSFGVLGTVSGLNANTSVTLINNGSSTVTVSSSGSFVFPNVIGQGSSYNVTVGTQPAWQNCTVSNGTGSNVTANVTNIAVTCIANHYAYVTNPSTATPTLSVYSISPTTGLFSTLGTITTGFGPTGAAVSANGNYVYVTNDKDCSIGQYSLNSSNGYPTLVGTFAVLTPSCGGQNGNVVVIVLSPNGKYAYIANPVDNTIQQYSVSASNGALSSPAIASVSTGSSSQPDGITISPDGSNLYVANGGNGTIAQYSINSTTGAIGLLRTLNLPTNTAPSGIAFTLNGHNAYVSDFNNGVILQYSVTNGSLASIQTTSVATGSNPNGLAISPDGSYVYVVNSAGYPQTTGTTISYYSIDPTSGALTPAQPALMDTTVPLNGIAIR